MDVDSFTRHIFSWVFNGDDDYCQGVGVLDTDNPAAKFYWIEWDMAHSYFDGTAEITNINHENWQQSAIKLIYNDAEKYDCDRLLIFSRLMDTVPSYRTYAIDLFTEILNHNLTSNFLTSRVDYYSSMISSFGDYDRYIDMLQKFMANRGDFIRADMAKRFQISGPFTLTVKGEEHLDLIVDGYQYKNSYSGKYFGGQVVKVSLNGSSSPGTISHWLVNGELVNSPALNIAIDRDTNIEMVSSKISHK